MRTVTILGATGSVGASTLDLIEREPEAGRIAQAPREHLEVVEALDEHPALGLEPDRHAHALGARQHALHAVHQQRPRADGIQGPAHRP